MTFNQQVYFIQIQGGIIYVVDLVPHILWMFRGNDMTVMNRYMYEKYEICLQQFKFGKMLAVNFFYSFYNISGPFLTFLKTLGIMIGHF